MKEENLIKVQTLKRKFWEQLEYLQMTDPVAPEHILGWLTGTQGFTEALVQLPHTEQLFKWGVPDHRQARIKREKPQLFLG